MNKDPETSERTVRKNRRRRAKTLPESRTAEAEKTNDTLRTEIIKFEHIQREMVLALQAQAAEVTRVSQALLEQVSERMRAAEASRQSEERYRNMADALPVLIWQSGPDKLCTYFNQGWLEFTGRTMAQELGNGWAEGVHPDDYERCLNIYASAFERREPFVMEYRLRDRSGEYRWILDRGVPYFSSDGTFLGYIGGAIDTHDRKVAEQALRDSDERERKTAKFNQAVITSMGEGLYILDSQGLVTYVNPTAERLFGWCSTELVGRKMHDMTHYQYPDGRPFPVHECPGLQVLQKGMVLSDHEDVFIRKDGTFFPVVYSSSPIASDHGIAGLVVVFRDLTAQKEAQEALARSQQALRTLAASLQATHEAKRSVLAREIHDELSGSLTALKMDLALLPDRVAKDHKLFLEKLNSMSALIDRTLARLHTIVTELRPVVLDKFGLVAAIEWQTNEFQQRFGIPCELRLPPQEIAWDSERSTAVFRIFQEALTNVARHSNATRVTIDLTSETGRSVLRVRDNGDGINETAIHARDSIGLLGMRERALSFGGTTEVIRLPEGGTLVRVTIPTDEITRAAFE